jgi:hypothetical protein
LQSDLVSLWLSGWLSGSLAKFVWIVGVGLVPTLN